MSQPSIEEYTSTSPVPGIKDNVGSQSHHPFGRVDILENSFNLKAEHEHKCVCEGGP